MTGLLYKEIRQFWYVLLTALLFPVLIIWGVPLFVWATHAESFAETLEGFLAMSPIRIMVMFAYLIVGMTEGILFSDDEKKKWCFFMMSLPKGHRGHLYAKFVVTLLTSVLLTVSMLFQWSLLHTVCWCMLGTEDAAPDVSLLITLLFLQILLRAFDIPFFVRFGVQQGSAVKVYCFLGLLLLGAVYLLFGPLPENFEDFTANLIERAASGRFGEDITLGLNILPYLALGCYYAAYRISCRLYQKGAAEYE